MVAQALVRGALTVLIAVLAVDVLALGDAAVRWLTAALGVGGLVGGLVAASVVHATRLGRSFVVGVFLRGLPLSVLALVPTPAVAYVALVVVGIGNAVEDIGAFTLIARLASPRAVGRVLAATELLVLVGVGIGSVVAPPLVDALGMSGTLGLLGGGLAALALGHSARFGRLDRTMPAPGPGLELMRSLPTFAPLSLAVTERVATELRPHHFPAGSVVIREGETGTSSTSCARDPPRSACAAPPGRPWPAATTSVRSRSFVTYRVRRRSLRQNPCTRSAWDGRSS